MGYYYVNGKSDVRLQKYLRKSSPDQKLPLRRMDEEESLLLCKLHYTQREMNLLVLECLAIVDVLKSFGGPEIQYLVVNMYRITQSVLRQRDLVIATRRTFVCVQPDPDELAAVRLLVTQCGTRVKYLRETVLIGNLELTPIKEYLVIRGFKTMYEELMDYFGSPSEIFNASKDGRIQEYARNIIQVVEKAGQIDASRERLTEYARMDAERARAQKQARKEEEDARRKRDADSGIEVFCRMFNKCVRTMSGNSLIRLAWEVLYHKINRYGRKACVILCCYSYGNDVMYRYINNQGKQVTSFTDAHLFDRESADAMQRKLEKENPTKAYCVCCFE